MKSVRSIVWLLCTYFCCTSIGIAQNQTSIDSLLNLINTKIPPKEKVDTYVLIADEYINSDSLQTANYANKAIKLAEQIQYAEGKIDALYKIAWNIMQAGQFEKAIERYQQLVQLAQNANYPKGKALALNGLSTTYQYKADYDKSLEFSFAKLAIENQLDHKLGVADTHHNIASCYLARGTYDKALTYQLKALNDYQTLDYEKGIAMCYINLGYLNRYQKNYEKSLLYYLKSLEINKKLKDKRHIAYAYNNIGVLYNEQGKYDKALQNHFKALELNKELGGERMIAYNYNNIGEVYMNLGQNKIALDYLTKAKDLRYELGDNLTLPYTLNIIANFYLAQKEWTKAKKYAKEAFDLAEDTGNHEYKKEAAALLSSIEEKLGNFKNALAAHKIFKSISDSAKHNETSVKLARAEADFEFEQEKDSLQFSAQAQRALLEKEIEKHEVKQISTLIGLVLVVLLATVLFVFFRSTSIANKKIEKQKQEIAIQNEQLLELNKQKDKMFSVVAHDLKSPIDSLQSLLMLFKDDNSMSEIQLQQHIARLSQNIEGVSGLLNNLLQWSKTKMQGKLSLSPIPLMLEPYVQEAVQLHLELARTKNIHTLLKIDKDLPQLCVDPEVLRFLLRNLLSNAYKYSDQHSEILVEANSIANNKVIINVIDTGTGLDEQTKNSLFTHLVKSEKGTQFENGTGLGLLLCKEFVELSHGEIGVESVLGQGSKFWFSLPITADNTLTTKTEKQFAHS